MHRPERSGRNRCSGKPCRLGASSGRVVPPSQPRATREHPGGEMAEIARQLGVEQVARLRVGKAPARVDRPYRLHPSLQVMQRRPAPADRAGEQRRGGGPRRAGEERRQQGQHEIELRLQRQRPERAVDRHRSAGHGREVMHEEDVGREVLEHVGRVVAPELEAAHQRDEREEEQQELHVIGREDPVHAATVELARRRRRRAFLDVPQPRQHEEEARDQEEQVHADHAVAHDHLEEGHGIGARDPRICEARVHDDAVVEHHHEQHRDAAQALDRGDEADLGAHTLGSRGHQNGTRSA